MKTETRHFYYISNAHDTITVGAHIHADGPHPILWHNKGLYCIISKQKVQNILDVIEDTENLPILNRKKVNVFHWDDGTLIDAKIASKLL